MKHNWEYKPFKQLSDILYGCPFESEFFNSESKGMPLIRIRDVKPGYTSTYFNGGYSDDYIIKKGDYLIGMDGEFNIAPWQSEDALLNQRVCRVKSINENVILSNFIYYFLGKELKDIEAQTSFVTVKHLSAKVLNAINTPVPPMEVQERIVAELDKINETIEDCRELLRNLDALALSLFYDYFGDPAINPKGWRIYKIKDICSVNPTKREIRIPTSSEISFLPMEDLPINARYFTPIKVKTLNEVQNSYTYFSGEDVLFAKVTPCFENGKAGIPVNLINNIGFGSSELFVLRPNFQIINREYIYSFIGTNHFVSEAIKKLSGTSGLRRVPRTVVENFQIPVPPLELQEKFAARMEEIEAQKKIVESTIAELQTLLDSRMDYWFN